MDKNNLISQSQEWLALQQHAQQWQSQGINQKEWFVVSAAGISLDYSNNPIDQTSLDLLENLAKRADLKKAIESLFAGAIVNLSEFRPALHTALRDPNGLYHEEVYAVQQQMAEIVDSVQRDSSIKHVVNIGIGGSDLGPKMVYEALKPLQISHQTFHFVSNVDQRDIQDCLAQCDPTATLFIVCSKTFTTQETLQNFQYAKQWSKTKDPKYFIAVTAAPDKAREQGFTMILPFWDWVGGRYSVWSAVGLGVAIALGMPVFKELLAGAHAMDQHFAKAPFKENLPSILGLIGVWLNNFFAAHSRAIIPYAQSLKLLPDYLQQLYMESLGKRVTAIGEAVDYATGYILWGGVGTNTQHSFHQLLLQGTHIVPTDFILPLKNNQSEMIANCLAQSRVFANGYSSNDVQQTIPGNRPHNLILLKTLNAKTLGALIALYEHKVYVQSVIWQINAFDQWGVQRGKVVAQDILAQLNANKPTSPIVELIKEALHD